MGELSVLPEAAESVLQELRALRLCRRQKRRQVVVSFWGFGSTPLRDKLLAGLRHALRTEKVYCSDVGPQRFEGIVCVCRRQLSSLRQLATHVRMGMEVLELLRCSRCLQCEAETVRPALLASVARIHSGTSTQGHHPVSWGKGFKDAFEQMQLRDSVLQVTGVELDAHNMTMLYMAQQATDHGLQYYRTRCRHVQRMLEAAAATADLLQRENSRMLFELQRAYVAGTASAEVFHMVMFGDLGAHANR